MSAGAARSETPAAVADPRQEIDAALQEFLAGQRDVLVSVHPDVEPVIAAAEGYLAGGKRLRPAFCYWGWRATGEPATPATIRAAASLELLQACALIHDDVMDDSDTRRGRPAAHKQFEQLHADTGWLGDATAYGTGAAILLGDLFLTWSDQLFSASGLPPAALRRARPLFDAMRTELMAGQYLDLVAQVQAAPDPGLIATVLRYKSAKYTIEHPIRLGATLAGADDAFIDGLGGFGLPLGEAFQLRDDVLGVFGDPAVTGKPAGDDLREGKQTLLIAEAMARVEPAEAELLRAGVGDPDLDDDGVRRMLGILDRSGALGAVEEQIDERLRASLAALDALPLDPEARQALRTLAAAAVDRVR